MRSRTLRRATLTVMIAAGPLGTACELALDFDRTPLQPIYEAGVDAPAEAASDASSERSSDATQGSDAREAASPEINDSGMDAEGG